MKSEIKNYQCQSCGAPMSYSPSKQKLFCEFCNNAQEIKTKIDYNPKKPLNEGYSNATIDSVEKSVTCPKCGAGYVMPQFLVATRCPYCETPAISQFQNGIKPPFAIQPFRVSQKKAHEIFAKWIGSLWFAPSELKSVVDTRKKLTGYYLPYWLFDSDTTSYYSGERGDAYYVDVPVTRVVNGKEETVMQRERRINWTPVSGTVGRDFRNIPIVADTKLPKRLLNSISSWGVAKLREFDDRFICGFEGSEYNRSIENCYSEAKDYMQKRIRADVRADIGGDEQRISNINTTYKNEMYGYTMFPVWSTHFRYKGKEYYYVINGFNGQIAGQRPYSYIKIAILIFIIVIIGVGYYYYTQNH